MARAAESRLLTEVVDAGSTHPGDPAGAVVFAPAGIGKTRLVREALRRAREHGISTAAVIATRSDRLTPYAGVAHLAPGVTPEGHEDVRSWYRAIAGALTRDGAARPVLTVDDAHLLDPGSAGLVLHLAVTGAATVIASIRDGEPVPDPITALWKDGLARRIDLLPFGSDQVGELVAAGLGGPVSHRTIHQLAVVSGGNALYVRELVLAAVASHDLALREGMWRWSEQIVLAPALIDAVGRRLSGLNQDERRALALIALGEPLPLSQLEQLVSPDTLARLHRAGLIEAGGEAGTSTCRLAHPLYGEVVVAQLGPFGRRGTLRALADTLAARTDLRPDDRVRLTRWRLEVDDPADPGDLLTAAEYANRTFDYLLAERLARPALDGGAGPAAAVALAVALAGQLRFAEADQVLAAHEQAIMATRDLALLQVYLFARTWALYIGLGRTADTRAMYDRFEATLGASSAPATAMARRMLAGHRANLALDEGRSATVLAITAPVLDDRDSGGLTALLCLEAAAEAMAQRGELTRARALHQRMRDLARTGPLEVRRATRSAMMQDILCDSLDGQASVALPKVVALSERLIGDPDPTSRGLAALIRGAVELQHGTIATARETLRDALLGLTAPDVRAIATWPYALLAQAEAMLGHQGESERVLALARDGRSARRRIGRMEADFVLATAWCDVAAGRVEQARGQLFVEAERLAELPMHRIRLLHAALVLGAPPRDVLRPLRRIAAQVEAGLPGLFARHAQALAEPDAPGLDPVIDEYDRRGLWLHGAEAAAQASQLFRRTGRPAEAARAAARSRLLAERCEGARTPALEDGTALVGLSRRERQVARLAADGLTNTEIAARLFVSVRTVESHLYQAFAKLGIDRRTDLRAVLGGAVPAQPTRPD